MVYGLRVVAGIGVGGCGAAPAASAEGTVIEGGLLLRWLQGVGGFGFVFGWHMLVCFRCPIRRRGRSRCYSDLGRGLLLLLR